MKSILAFLAPGLLLAESSLRGLVRSASGWQDVFFFGKRKNRTSVKNRKNMISPRKVDVPTVFFFWIFVFFYPGIKRGTRERIIATM